MLPPTKRIRPVSTDIFGGGQKYQCPICFKWFTSQGYPNHERSHERNGDKVENKKPNGRVKLHGEKYEIPFVKDTTSTSIDLTTPESLVENTTSTTPVQEEVEQHRSRSITGGLRNFTNKVSS